MQRLLNRLRVRYDRFPTTTRAFNRPRPPVERDSEEAKAWFRSYWPGYVDTDFLRYWLTNSNITDEDFQAMAEYNAEEGRWSVARFCRLMCFTSKTQRKAIR